MTGQNIESIEKNIKVTDREEEISIFDIFAILYRSKILIFTITFISVLGGYIYYNSQPLTVYSEYNIYSISNKEKNKYDQFNSQTQSLFDGEMKIDPAYLKKLFIEQIKSYEDIKLALEKHQIVEKNNFNSQIEYEKALQNFVLRFNLEEKITNQDKDESNVKLIYTDNLFDIDRNQISLLFDEIIFSANENVRIGLVDEFQNRVKFKKLSNEYRKLELKNNIDSVRERFLIESQNRILFLEEQAEMARHLDIADSLDVDSVPSNITNIIIEEDVKEAAELNQYYLIGYKAIEKEIEIMKNRSEADPYIDEVVYYTQRINAIDNDLSTERADYLFNLTPAVNNDDFKSIVLNTNYHLKIKIINELNKFLLIFGVLGFFMSSIFVISSYYINKKSYF